MLVEEIDNFGLEPPEGSLGNFLDVRRAAVQARLLAGSRIEFEAELGGDDHAIAKGSEALTDEFFVGERAIDFSGVEESDAAVHGVGQKRDHLLLVFGWAIGKTH